MTARAILLTTYISPPDHRRERDRPMIGKTISHYKILEKLGEGGMGVVYRAEDTKLGRTVALKLLAPHTLGNYENQARLEREARSAASLNHPGICTIYEIDRAEGRSFIAMECVEGRSLREEIESGPMELDRAIEIAVQVAGGLEQAHARGIIHRDIKPANIMLTPAGEAKITDFGLAKPLGATNLTRSGVTIGTVAYMSPEQARGAEVDARTDVWALGAVLYEMATGRPPFRGDYEQAVIYQILNEPPEPVTALRSDAPGGLERIVSKALAKAPGERYGSAGELRRDLESLRAGGRSALSAGESTSPRAKPSIAVLPFTDMSPDRDQEYFCEGIAEELINALVKLDGLRVAARTSAFQLKDREGDVKTIGARLGVRNVLEGSVRKSGDRLRITAQLVDVKDGFHLWSEKYDRDLEDIFAIQDEISLAIVDRLRVRLLGDERRTLVKRYTADKEAHNLYLKGLYFWNRRLEGGMKTAMEHFRRAVERDPGYALAYVGIADTYSSTGFLGYLLPKESFPKAREAAERALEIDETLGEAHASLAFINMFFDWDWTTAEAEFRRAIELNPTYATAHQWYGLYLSLMGRSDDGIAESERARELDPLSPLVNTLAAASYYFAGRYEESIAILRKTLEMYPDFLPANGYVALAYVASGRCEEAVLAMRRFEGSALGHAYTLGHVGYAYAVCGREDDALRVLGLLDEIAGERYVSPAHRAPVLLGLGRLDEALELMEKAHLERSPWLFFAKTSLYYERLHSEPRYQDLLRRIGLQS
jgi:serine/threonine protein kinase/tetratricopeptide (TPR) repeat protein